MDGANLFISTLDIGPDDPGGQQSIGSPRASRFASDSEISLTVSIGTTATGGGTEIEVLAIADAALL